MESGNSNIFTIFYKYKTIIKQSLFKKKKKAWGFKGGWTLSSDDLIVWLCLPPCWSQALCDSSRAGAPLPLHPLWLEFSRKEPRLSQNFCQTLCASLLLAEPPTQLLEPEEWEVLTGFHLPPASALSWGLIVRKQWMHQKIGGCHLKQMNGCRVAKNNRRPIPASTLVVVVCSHMKCWWWVFHILTCQNS